MDWKYEHFNQEAVFNAPIPGVLEAARQVVGDSTDQVEETPDGFIARGRSGWHAIQATFRAASVATGTQLKVELRVERYSSWGYILVDAFGFYNARIDKWFAEISQRLGPSEQDAIVSKSTMSYRVQRGCLGGCLVWLIAGTCLGVAATAADHALFPQSFSGSTPGPFTLLGSLLAFALGIVTFLYIRIPDGPVARFVKSRLLRKRNDGAV